MSDLPTDVSRPSALPTANLFRSQLPIQIHDQNSAQYLDAIEEDWNKKVDTEVDSLVDGMLDLVALASARLFPLTLSFHLPSLRLLTRTSSE